MQYKTSMKEFQPYGCVYSHSIVPNNNDLTEQLYSLTPNQSITRLFSFDCPAYLEMESGMASLVVGFSDDTDKLQTFCIHRKVCLKPGVHFSLATADTNAKCRLITSSGFSPSSRQLKEPFFFNRILPDIQIREILGYYYNVKHSGYHFPGERHDHYEITYVDRGRLRTTIEEKSYLLEEKELILYGPGQFHTQTVEEGDSCSFVTVLFTMESIDQESIQRENVILLNRIFPCDKKIYSLISSFVQESRLSLPYLNSLMLCLLQEIIIRLLQSDFSFTKKERPSTAGRLTCQNELLERILTYIDENLYEPLTISEICREFSLSRSCLQLLFKENLEQTPKKYICDLKLEKSCQLIREQKYTLSEIALMLGFNSIHYFSRSFHRKYHLAPSEYAKQLPYE